MCRCAGTQKKSLAQISQWKIINDTQIYFREYNHFRTVSNREQFPQPNLQGSHRAELYPGVHLLDQAAVALAVQPHELDPAETELLSLFSNTAHSHGSPANRHHNRQD